ncbi:SDR family oxidoreductase [Mycolicibacterium holsaticum]|uniref:LysR family transcriptional regulator n=1 Tax=Mycolicibacterium holsaticum TaxID=152142 RepID=A0A1E3RWD7_9MYCO|nr:NAD(P)H-binding protein [Mycolicibacterium holsaticum]ODQ94164.1 LysR family transcriptional regulator [Mycolicibacterium holsaticum]
MKITVIGATGLIGSKVVPLLEAGGNTVVSASRQSGLDVLTGEGLADALSGADVLVDLTNSPSFEDEPVKQFFTTSTTNLVKAAAEAGVDHYVALSIVGADGLPDSGYMRAKVVQETILRQSGLPYTIVRATQFDEFAESITESLTIDGQVHAPDGMIQPIAGDDVAVQVARAAMAPARNGYVNIGGPDKLSFADLARAVLSAKGDDRPVVVDSTATYFGTRVDDHSLVTGDDATIAPIRFADWMASR